MKKPGLVILNLLLLIQVVFSQKTTQSISDDAVFKNPPSSAKVHSWWHWVQGSISKDGITKDLESMKAQGIAEATIINVGLIENKEYLVPQVKFDTDAWYDMFEWALTEAKRLGITIGAHNSDGWSTSGGPWITPAQSMKTFTWSKTQVDGSKKITINLKKPFNRANYYEDVAVVAVPAKVEPSAFQKSQPTFELNKINVDGLADGSLSGGPTLKNDDTLKVSLDKPIKVSRLAIASEKPFTWADPTKMDVGYNLFYSMDGQHYKLACNAMFKGINKIATFDFPEVEGRYFRLEFSQFPWTDAWFAYTLAEVELLKAGETVFSTATLPEVLEKNATVRSSGKDIYGSDNFKNKRGLARNQIIDITKYMTADGVLNWTAPAGKWNIIRFGYTTTGAVNSPATKDGEGLECDKMDSSAVSYHFSKFPQKLIDHAGNLTGNTFKFILIDSWECGLQNWTKSLPMEFEKRRGYKLTSFIPVLCGEIITDEASSEAFLFDYRKTIAELVEANYYKHFASLCHKNKLEMHSEVIYGSGMYPPIDVLKTNQYADMPMFEFWAGNSGTTSLPSYTASKNTNVDFPASAALFYDKKILGAEAYTGFTHYSESPWELKPFGDRAYCSGINQLILHSYVHQPTDSLPGLTLGGFAAPFNRNTSWFNFAGSWMDYHARMQYMLQQGQMQADVLYYVGDQLPQYLEAGNAVNVPKGYQIHVANYDVLKNKLAIKNGKLTFGSVAFSLLTLPENMGMELPTLLRLEELVKAGLVLYGPRPTRLLSMNGIKNNDLRFKQLVEKIWGKVDGASVKERSYGKGKVYWGESMNTVLQKIKLKPDFETLSTDTTTFLYTHRSSGNKEIYFVFNQENKVNTRDLYFRSVSSSVKEYNPMDGSIKPIAFSKTADGRTKIPFSFGANASRIFVFEQGNDKAVNPNELRKEVTELTDFKGTINFDTRGYGKIEPVNISHLQSLTEFKNTDIKYFAGFATYNINFKAPASYLNTKEKVLLDLGEVGVTASVVLNGQLLGTVWNANTQFDISSLLKAENSLQVVVGNEQRNRIIGDFIEFGKLKNNWTTAPIKDYLDKDKQLKPAGLIGPIELIRFSN